MLCGINTNDATHQTCRLQCIFILVKIAVLTILNLCKDHFVVCFILSERCVL